MNIKGIIFDFGFTLAYFKDVSLEKYFDCFKRGLHKSVDLLKKANILEDNSYLIESFFKLFKKKRMSFFRQSVKTKIEFPTTYVFQKVLEQTVNKELIDNLTDDLYVELANLYHFFEENEWIPFKETRDTLNKINKLEDIKIAVLSNHPHHSSIKSMLKKHDLFEFFDAVVTSAKFGKRKPHPDIFHHTLKKMGLKSEDASLCLMCGDEYADIIGGRRAGLKTILFEREFVFPFEKEIKKLETLRVNNISEILNHIN